MTIKVPLSLDERTLLHFAERDAKTGQLVPDVEFAELTSSIAFARGEAETLVNLTNAVRADRSQSVDAGLLKTSNAAMKSAERVAARLDAARGRTMATIAGIEKKISAPPAPTNPYAIQAEFAIQTRLASMGDKERADAIDAAFASKDEQVIGAVLRGPAFMAGLGKAKQDGLRHRYGLEFHPQDAARRAKLVKVLEAHTRAGDTFVSLVRELTDSKAAKIAAANAQRAEDAFAAHRKKEAQ